MQLAAWEKLGEIARPEENGGADDFNEPGHAAAWKTAIKTGPTLSAYMRLLCER